MFPSAKNESAEAPVGSQADSKPTLSSREQEVLMAAWLSIKGSEPQIDYEKLAKILGLKNAHTASTVFCNVKKKVKVFRSQVHDASDSQPSTPASRTATPRKRVAGKSPATPSRSGKAAKRVKSEDSPPKTPQSHDEDEKDGV